MSAHILNFHDTVLLATGFQSLLFILLILLVKHEKHISDYFLVGFFAAQIAISLHLLINFNTEIRAFSLQYTPNMLHIFDIAYWVEGPLLLWYSRSILYKDFTIRKKDALYLLPTLMYFIFMSALFYALETSEKVEFLIAEQEADAPSIRHITEVIREGFRVFFGVLCLMSIRRARHELRDRFSNTLMISTRWLSTLVIAFTAVRVWTLLVVLIAIVAPDLGKSVFNYMGLGGNYLTFGLITVLMFFSLQRSTIFAWHTMHDTTAPEQETDEHDPELAKKIETYMAESKPYLHPLLNLEQLASQLAMHPRALSTAIKQQFKTNFYEFVNSYRINEAKVILADPEQKRKTMIEISGECGFNSKATYNSFFKKLVGSTPSQYRAKQLPE